MAKLGILFNIDELGGGLYGMAAYKILFSAIDTRRLAGCGLSDGDTNATLSGSARQYCIAVESADTSQIALVRQTLARSNAKGLLPLSARFLEDEQVRAEPLVEAAQVTAAGEVMGGPGWIVGAWKQAQEEQMHQPAPLATAAGPSYCVKCGSLVHPADHFCPKCGTAQAAAPGAGLSPTDLFNVYSPGFDLAKLAPSQAERFKKHEFIDTFPTALVVLLHIFTLGIFTVIFQGLKHSRMPLIRYDDFRAGKAIGFMFIPFFNLYWLFVFWLRLVDRINFQYRLRGHPEAVSRGLAMTTCVLGVIPYVNILVAYPILMSILTAQVQSAANRLAEMQMSRPA